jgi:hypothetical protein
VSDFPQAWYWDEDGAEIVGRYCGFSEGYTKSGASVPIIELEVEGERRAVWAFHMALREKFLAEIKERPEKDLDPGELITIRRGEERESNAHEGWRYREYDVTFEHKHKPSPLELLSESVPQPPADDDESVPF